MTFFVYNQQQQHNNDSNNIIINNNNHYVLWGHSVLERCAFTEEKRYLSKFLNSSISGPFLAQTQTQTQTAVSALSLRK